MTINAYKWIILWPSLECLLSTDLSNFSGQSYMLWLQRLCRLHSIPPDALWDFGMFVCLCASQKFLNVTIQYLSYAVGFLPHFSPHYILYIICVDSGDTWSGRCLIECVIYAKEVTPNLFQHAGNPQHTNAQITTDLHIHTRMFSDSDFHCIASTGSLTVTASL